VAVREDGSAKFYKSNRWGFFPSFSAGWRLSEESFVKDRISNLDNLKLRLSYGKTGNDNVAAYQYITGYNYPGSSNYIFGSSVVKSIDSKGLANQNFTWYSSTIYNGGVDVSLWDRLLEGSLDVFYRKRSGLLATRLLSLPNTFGASLPQENLNSDDNRGFELTLGHTSRINDFRYSVKGNVSYTRARNRYIEQADPINSYLYWRNNRSDRWSNTAYGYKYIGQFRNQEEINSWAIQDGAGNTTLLPGDLKYEDLNGDGIINDLDVQPIGRDNTPEVYFGLDLSANWKGFDLSALFQGATNYSRYMYSLFGTPLFNGGTAVDYFMDRWHKEDIFDPDSKWVPGKYPATYSSGKPNNTRISNFNTLNAFYCRLKNIELGYTFPKPWVAKAGMSNLRLYISGYNVLTFDNLSFGDPELPSSGILTYPQMKSWNLGVNITF
jgi:TonB-linked SusC/RagA family outer membrane protein